MKGLILSQPLFSMHSQSESLNYHHGLVSRNWNETSWKINRKSSWRGRSGFLACKKESIYSIIKQILSFSWKSHLVIIHYTPFQMTTASRWSCSSPRSEPSRRAIQCALSAPVLVRLGMYVDTLRFFCPFLIIILIIMHSSYPSSPLPLTPRIPPHTTLNLCALHALPALVVTVAIGFIYLEDIYILGPLLYGKGIES